MSYKALSVIARVGMAAFLIYALWPYVITLRDHAQSGNMTPVEWVMLIYSLLLAACFALALVAVVVIVVFSWLSAGARVLSNHLVLLLRDAASQPTGR